MSPWQDPVPATPDNTPRLSRDVVRRQDYVPMFWIYGTGGTLLVIACLVLLVSASTVNPPPADSTWMWQTLGVWQTLGFLLLSLSLFVFSVIPGALIVMRHPWGVVFFVMAAERYAHPRLVGATEVLIGIVCSVGMSAVLFAPNSFLFTSSGLIACALTVVVLGTIVLFLTLYLLDRRL